MSTKEEPAYNADGTVTAALDQYVDSSPFQPAVGFGLLRLALPVEPPIRLSAGRYFLARCGAQSPMERATQWGIYFRRPLFVANTTHEQAGQVQFAIPYHPFISVDSGIADRVPDQSAEINDSRDVPRIVDPGYAWLASLADQESVNLMGPFGQGFEIGLDQRNLLLVAEGWRVAKLLPLVEEMLNRGGRVTMLVTVDSGQENSASVGGQSTPPPSVSERDMQSWLLTKLPIAVELRLATSDQEFQAEMGATLKWADQLCAALPEARLSALAMLIRDKRFHLQEGFAQVLVDADLICGVGACLACVVGTANGSHTRSCVHGPVFDLTKLVR